MKSKQCGARCISRRTVGRRRQILKVLRRMRGRGMSQKQFLKYATLGLSSLF